MTVSSTRATAIVLSPDHQTVEKKYLHFEDLWYIEIVVEQEKIMKALKKIGSNMYEFRAGNVIILVSYETPVAAFVDGRYLRTTMFFSQTTSRHINKWLDGVRADYIEQKDLEALLHNS